MQHNGGVCFQESLRRSSALEALHLSLSLSDEELGVFSTVVVP